MRVLGILSAVLTVFSVLVVPTGKAWANPTTSVVAALDELHTWLGEDEKAQRWRSFLRSEALQAELAKGADADLSAVSQILGIYSSNTPGLGKRHFRAVRDALGDWIGLLPLAAAAREAKADFVPLDPERLGEVRAQLVRAIEALDQYLIGGGEAKRRAWKNFLHWDQLQEVLDQEETPEVRALQRIGVRYYTDQPGLERPKFRAVRGALSDYVDALIFSREDFQQQYEFQLDELSRRLEAYVSDPSHENSSAVALRLDWLRRAGQTSGLVESIAGQFERPNLVVRISEKLVTAGVDREVDETQPIREVILGTRIRGTGHTRGAVKAQLVPNADAVQLEIRLSGTMRSSSRGYNGPVTLSSSGVTSILATKQFYFDADGFRDSPASASCNTRSTIHDIAGGALARDIAWSRARSSKQQADAIASQRAESRVANRMDENSREEVRQANADYQERFNAPLTEHGIFPADMDFSSTSDAVLIHMRTAGRLQLSVASPSPQFDGDSDLAVMVHESWFNNNVATLLGGKKFDAQRTADLVESLLGEAPEELQSDPEEEPWTITFSRQRPLSVQLDDQKVTITIRSRQFTSADRKVRPMITTVVYQSEKHSDGVRLVMDGEVNILPADFHTRERKILSAAETAERAILKKRIDEALQKEYLVELPELPDDISEGGELVLQHLNIDHGWFQAGWIQMPMESVPLTVTD